MKRLSILTIFLFAVLGTYAQNRKAMEKIESARIALITERLELTPAQAEKFWPLYREYNEQRRLLRQEFRNSRQGLDMQNLSDEQSKELMQQAMDMKQRQLNLEKKYADRMTEVISSQQMVRLRNAEKDFQDMLIRRIQNQRQQQDQNQKMMQRREMLRDKNNN